MKILSILIAAITLSIAIASSPHQLQKRRMAPLTDSPLTLQELERQCIHHSWVSCKERAKSMLNPTSSENRKYNECNRTATSAINLENHSRYPTETSEWCPTSTLKAQEEAREHYCQTIHDIHTKAANILRIGTRVSCSLDELADSSSVATKSSKDHISPENITRGIELWINHMGQVTRTKCCSKYNIVFKIPPRRIGRSCDRPSMDRHGLSKTSTEVWSDKLGRIAELMRAEIFMGNIGRRKKCLRGCGNRQQVECVRQTVNEETGVTFSHTPLT